MLIWQAFDEDFADIDAAQLADGAMGWPSHVATVLKDLVRSASQKCLCHQSNRKKLAVADALTSLTTLAADADGGNAGSRSALEGASSPSSRTEERSPSMAASATGYTPTPLSVQVSQPILATKTSPNRMWTHCGSPITWQVREMRRGGDAQKGIKQNMLLAFDNVMLRLNAVYAGKAAEAPEDFERKIHFWHSNCAMPAGLKDRLHTLRIWANAARHHDDERWRRDGPRNEAEASRLLSSVQAAIETLWR